MALENITVTEKDGKLVITCDVDKPYGTTARGNIGLATTRGFEPVAVNGQVLKLSLNLMRSA